jgi:hypothetical protein
MTASLPSTRRKTGASIRAASFTSLVLFFLFEKCLKQVRTHVLVLGVITLAEKWLVVVFIRAVNRDVVTVDFDACVVIEDLLHVEGRNFRYVGAYWCGVCVKNVRNLFVQYQP